MKKGVLFLCILVVITMGAFLVYELFFAPEKDYSVIGKTAQNFVVYILIVLGIVVRRNKLKKYSSVLVKEAFAHDRSSYRKLIKAIDDFCNKEYKKALKRLEKLEDKCESNNDATVVKLFMAMCYHAENKYEEAIAIYERMLATDGGNAYAWAYLGRIYDERKQREFALQAYENALQYQPNNAFVHCCLAYHHMEGIELEKAYHSAIEAIKLDKKRDDAAVIAALYCAFNGKEDLARKFYRCYYGEKEQDKKLKTWIKNICTNKSMPSTMYCGNVREFQHLFQL